MLLYDNDEIVLDYFYQVNLLPSHRENMEYSLTRKEKKTLQIKIESIRLYLLQVLRQDHLLMLVEGYFDYLINKLDCLLIEPIEQLFELK